MVDHDQRVLGVVSEADLLLKEEFPEPDKDILLWWTKRARLERERAAVLQGRVERRSLLPCVVRAVQGVEGVVQVENRLAYDLDDQDADRLMTYPWIRA